LSAAACAGVFWSRRLFSFLYRNSIHPADRFNIPAQNFVQIGREIEV
jgi:K+ transporter